IEVDLRRAVGAEVGGLLLRYADVAGGLRADGRACLALGRLHLAEGGLGLGDGLAVAVRARDAGLELEPGEGGGAALVVHGVPDLGLYRLHLLGQPLYLGLQVEVAGDGLGGFERAEVAAHHGACPVRGGWWLIALPRYE